MCTQIQNGIIYPCVVVLARIFVISCQDFLSYLTPYLFSHHKWYPKFHKWWYNMLMFRSCGNPGNGFLGLNGRFAGISEPSRNRGFKVHGLAFGFVYDQIWVSVLDLVLISVKFCCSKRAGEENYFQCNFSSNRITASHFYNMCCQRKRKVTVRGIMRLIGL